jgi:diadenosine tetraphosphate (Ap4A) HIT family hydrolase
MKKQMISKNWYKSHSEYDDNTGIFHGILTREQYDLWIETLPKGWCTFCKYDEPIGVPKVKQKVLKRFDNWVWIANIAPYWYWQTMISPKRHFIEEQDMSVEEMGEKIKASKYVESRYLKAKLRDKNDKLIENFVYFWRFRRKDRVGGESKVGHFHLHFAPQIEHSWDPTLEADAYKCDVVGKLK